MSEIAKALVVDLDDPTWFVEYQLGQLLILGFERVLIVDESFCFPYRRKRQAAIDLLWHWWRCDLGKRYYATSDAVRWSLVQCRWKPIPWLIERTGLEF
jgi:hypothetical protein